MARLLPNPAGDLWRRVDKMLADVDEVLPRVDGTLTTVGGTLATVDGTLRDATAVLASVRDLVGDLREKLELLDQVPALATQLQDVHRIVTALADAG